MAAPRYGRRKDKNQNELVSILQSMGVQVIDLSQVGDDIPDTLLICRGVLEFAEIKNPENWYGKGGLNDNQKSFAINNGVDIYVLRTIDDCRQYVNAETRDILYCPTAEDILRLSKQRRKR
jgi:hypothetical protein